MLELEIYLAGWRLFPRGPFGFRVSPGPIKGVSSKSFVENISRVSSVAGFSLRQADGVTLRPVPGLLHSTTMY